jgi:hypothetical protein
MRLLITGLVVMTVAFGGGAAVGVSLGRAHRAIVISVATKV